jgi:hypothetical protein
MFQPGVRSFIKDCREVSMDPVEPSQEFSNDQEDPVSKDPIANIKKLIRKRVPRFQAPRSREVKTRPDLWRAAALISLVVNVLFLVLILLIGNRLLHFKTTVVEPLLEGVYSAVGQIDDGVVQTEVTVSSEVPVVFDLPLQRETVVTLTQPTRIENAYLSIRSATFSVDAPSTIDLPIGAQLPISLDLTIPVSTTVPVELSVPVELNLSESTFQPVVSTLQELVEPYKLLAQDAPDCWQMLLWGGACP